MSRNYFPKFKCPDCEKKLGEFDLNYLSGDSIYDSASGLSYNTGKNYCNECYSIRTAKYVDLSEDEENDLKLESDNIECRFKTKSFGEKDYMVLIKEKWFIFDKEGYEKFNKYFDTNNYEIDVNVDGYLIRINKKNERNIESFHRWLMIYSGKLQEFVENKNLDSFDIHVHHKEENKKDNRFESLECKEGSLHYEEHAEESAWIKYRKEHTFIWYLKDKERFRKGKISIPEEIWRKKFHEWWIINGRK